MTKFLITATQGRQYDNTAEDDNHSVVEPESRLILQAADWETSLIRRVISVELLLIVLLLGWFLIVWQ